MVGVFLAFLGILPIFKPKKRFSGAWITSMNLFVRFFLWHGCPGYFPDNISAIRAKSEANGCSITTDFLRKGFYSSYTLGRVLSYG